MKANELMIGDWVYVDGVTTQVMQVNDDNEVWTHEEPFLPNDNVEPIPLTEEILEANGFIHHDYWNKCCYAYDAHKQDILWSMDFYFAPEKGIMEFGAAGKKATINDWHCEYVHQLQHALRLCGLTELADNFRIE